MLLKPIVVVCFLLLHVATTSRKKHHKKRYGRKHGSRRHAWEKSPHAEGDIMIDGNAGRNMMQEPTLWPDAVVPYEISKIFHSAQKYKIIRAMNSINENSCVQFVPRTEEHDHFIYFVGFPGSGCGTQVGFQKKNWKCYVHWVDLEVDAGCVHHAAILHELLHVLGFYHQHNVYNRDDYVTIVWSNIEDEKKKYFQKRPKSSHSFRYDYRSIMHGTSTYLSKNGEKTITPKNNNVEIGKAKKLSDMDWEKLKYMYKCLERKRSPKAKRSHSII